MQAVIVTLLSGLLMMQTPVAARQTDRERDGLVGNARCVETLGANGLPIEQDCRYYNPPAIAGRVKQAFSYEFDATGSWVKRYGSTWMGDNDKLKFIGKDATYRTISYDAAKDVRPDDG